MSPKQKLADLVALREALQSQRRSIINSRGNRGWRTARVKAAVKMIRAARETIATAVNSIMLLRDGDAMDTQVTKLDARIAQLTKQIRALDKTDKAAQMAEKVRRLQAQLREMNAQLPAGMRLEDIL